MLVVLPFWYQEMEQWNCWGTKIAKWNWNKQKFNLIQEWNLVNRIKFMCFETIASNTVAQDGACVILKKKNLAEKWTAYDVVNVGITKWN